VTFLEAAMDQMKAIAVEDAAAQEAAARREAEEKAQREECPASACDVYGPGEGNCEVNCVIAIPYSSVLKTLTIESAGSGASPAGDHTWRVPGPVAFALGSGITFQGSDIGHWVLDLAHIPGWISDALNHLGHRKLMELGSDLMKCGTEAIPGTLVTINAWGSLRYGYSWRITCLTYV
jgi:hypothetical protein